MKAYHHGDLRRALIEKGIEIIHEGGEAKLSLRKAAEQCGVSNAAPYAHFKSKDELLLAMQNYVMEQFAQSLKEAVEKCDDKSLALLRLGTAYVKFFYQNPQYYSFLFSRKNIEIDLSLHKNKAKNIPPLEILRATTKIVFEQSNFSEEMIENKVISMWALVHGLSAIVIMPNVEYGDDWETRIEKIIKSMTFCYEEEGDE